MKKSDTDKLELNKILSACEEYACLGGAKKLLKNQQPAVEVNACREALQFTSECYKLLFYIGVGKVGYFDDVSELLVRASKGSALSCGELLQVNGLLHSAREAYNSIACVSDDEIVAAKKLASKLLFDELLENDISEKIISAEAVSDRASEKLFTIRSRIRALNERIRSTLGEYVSGKDSQYLQESIVTMRNDRYVIPVKAEHKSHVKGFVHDRSASGATFFIEPEYVLELNNELVALAIDEREEIERILSALSKRVGARCGELTEDMNILYSLECGFAKAEYSHSIKGILPDLNSSGYINIVRGRHPLIDAEKVVPVTVSLGKSYNILLLSGANTGGKTVTLKMCGLFCLMAACGIFVPAQTGTSIAVFKNVFCDVGDSQSIEDSLSTFSSHITNVIDICNRADDKSLVLIDELGGGTNPDEGQAIAKAVCEYLLNVGCKGIITTHFTPLKEFAYSVDGVENASMEFDSATLKPLYSIKIGLPGASNALAISRRLGMSEEIISRAEGYLSEGARSFENIMRRAEDSRVEAERALARAEQAEKQWRDKLGEANKNNELLQKERDKLRVNARVESRRIINERTAYAEQLLDEIENIFKQEEISEADLIRARTLKNKIKNAAYDEDGNEEIHTPYIQATAENLRPNIEVYIEKTQSNGTVISVAPNKGEAEVLCGSIKFRCKISELRIISFKKKSEKQKVKIVQHIDRSQPILEINVIGMNVEEALAEVDNFIDKAVTDNLEEIKVIHGVGKGILKKAIARHLSRHKNVESFRLGKYGEGETGVTFIKLK